MYVSMTIHVVVVLCSKLDIWLMPYVEKTRIRVNHHIDQFKLYNIVSVTNFISEANRDIFAFLSFENENNISTIPWGILLCVSDLLSIIINQTTMKYYLVEKFYNILTYNIYIYIITPFRTYLLKRESTLC